MLKRFLSAYFGFDRRQRNGLLVLGVVCFLLMILRVSITHFITRQEIYTEELALVADSLQNPANEKKEKATTTVKGKAFDPNTVSEAALLQMGIPIKTVKTFVKLRSKGFVFRKKEDLKKVYGFSPEIYAALETFVHLPQTSQEEKGKQEKVNIAVEIIELNTADSAALTKLKGIGPSFAKRILKYRELLGGFVSREQLLEVYGLKQETFELVKNQVSVDASKIIRLHLNADEFKIINKHPYLSYEQTKMICNQRNSYPMNAEALRSIVNDDETYKKLLPYVQY